MERPLHRILAVGVGTVLASFAGPAGADQLIIAGAGPQEVTFTAFDGKKLTYRTRAGGVNDREIERVSHIAVDNEPAFSEAEAFFAKDEKDKSVDGYIKTLRSTNKPWLKAYAAQRLLQALAGSDRFDGKLVAYLSVLTTTPEVAAGLKPQLPDRGSKFLDTAVTDIETALKQPNLTPEQQVALYNFLLDIHRQRGDESAVVATLERVERLASTLGDIPEIKAQLASVKVQQARTALERKNYDEASKLINANRGSITSPAEQSDALFILAEAKRASTPQSDSGGLRDAALMYMRVVAHFNETEGRPNVLASLQAAAAVLEAAGDKADAVAAYEQIVTLFPDDPAAAKARQEIDRLKPAQ